MLKDKRRLAQVVALAAMLAVALPASALAEGKPTGAYKNFTLCPLKNSKVKQCLWSKTEAGSGGGEVKIGEQAVPIENPVSLQGGLYINFEAEEVEFVNAEGGPTVSNSPQTVPGGLLGLLPPESLPEPLKALLKEFINKGPTGVTATTEQVGAIHVNESNLVNGSTETAVLLPVRVHLNNAFLGEECFIGSASNPITLHLITGETSPPSPNKPITGKIGTLTFTEENKLLTITENSLVDNAFSVPVAEKCVNYVPLIGFITEALADEAIDGKLGLPSAAGKNTAILNGSIQKASAAAVKASE